MFIICVNGSDYKVKYGYKTLAKSGIMRDVIGVQSANGENGDMSEMLGLVMDVTAKMLLAGLQKYHADEFGVDYDIPSSVSSGLDRMYDILDDYMDSDASVSVIDLFTALTDELFNNGFLSKVPGANLKSKVEKLEKIHPVKKSK